MDSSLKRYPFTNGNVLKSKLHEASTALLGGSYRNAAQKFKSAIDNLDSGYPYSISEPSDSNLLIIRYALCTAQIQLGDYPNLASAVKQLTDLINNGHAKILPALYYALAKAYMMLFRFHIAKDKLAEGKRVLDHIDPIKVFYWPETEEPITETIRQGLEASMEEVKKKCGTYASPDARCKYKKCLEISDHIVPSEYIYFRDPKFSPFLVLTCEEKCKVEFHESCWKNMKKEADGIDKPKDMIGQPCPTKDCVSLSKEPSVVVEVKLVKGERPEDQKVYTSQNVPIKKPAINAKKKTKAEKDKCDEKVVAPLDKNKVKKREKKVSRELSPPGAPGQDCKLYDPPFEEQVAPKVELLEKLRKINFGFKSADIMNPMEVHYGNPQVRDLAFRRVFLDSLTSGDNEAYKKEFDLSLFYEFIKKHGVQNIKDINALKDIDGIDANAITDIWQLLLESPRFCAIGDKIGISEELPNLYKSADAEVLERTAQLGLGNPNLNPAKQQAPCNRNVGNRMSNEDSNMLNAFQFPPIHSGLPGRPDMVRPDMMVRPDLVRPDLVRPDLVRHDLGLPLPQPVSMASADTHNALNNYANDPLGAQWGTPAFLQRPPPPRDLASDLSSVSSDKNSSSDGGEPREFNAFAMDNILNANLPMKPVPIRNEHKNSVHSISSDDALNDNLDERRNENYTIGNPFDYQLSMNAIKNGDWNSDSIGGVPFSDKIDLSHIYRCYMGPRWVNDDQKTIDLQKDREIEKLKEQVKQGMLQTRQMEENYSRALTQSLEKRQAEIESLKITINNLESLLDEKSKKVKDLEMQNQALETELVSYESRIIDMWKQHEDFILKTINQRCSERLNTGHQLKKYLPENDRKKLEDEMHILETNERHSVELNRRAEEFIKLARERLRLNMRHHFIPEHSVDNDVGAFIVDQTLHFLRHGPAGPPAGPSAGPGLNAEPLQPYSQANKLNETVERPGLPLDGFYQQQPPSAFLTQPFGRPTLPPLMSLPINRPLLTEAPPPQFPTPPPPAPVRNLSQSSSRSSTPQPQPQPQPQVAPPTPSASDAHSSAVQRPASAEMNAASVVKSGAAPGGTKPKAAAAAAAAPVQPAQPKVPTKLPSSEKASVPFPIEVSGSATNFSTLTEEMCLIFPVVARQDIVKALKQIKGTRPNKSLNGMSAQIIADKLEALLATKEFKRPSHVGLEKFSSAAWGAAPNTSNNWKGSDENDCQICFEPMDVKYFLQCKHAFHEGCINEWGKTTAECPLCRKYFKTDRNYPELRSAAN